MGDYEQLVRRLIEDCVNSNRPDLLPDFVDRDVRVHPGTPGTAPATTGIDELQEAFRAFHQVFPDIQIVLDDVLAANDRVVTRWTATGTHRAELAGIPATGGSVRWGGIDIYRLANGKIAEWWRNDDFVGLLRQIGRDLLA